jgi:hypothetical protein
VCSKLDFQEGGVVQGNLAMVKEEAQIVYWKGQRKHIDGCNSGLLLVGAALLAPWLLLLAAAWRHGCFLYLIEVCCGTVCIVP